MNTVSIAIMENRLRKFREKLKEKDYDAALITKRENYIYISGFTGSSAYLVITQDDAILVTDFRYIEQAGMQAPLFKVTKYQGSLIIALNDILKEKGINSLGFEEAYITYETYADYKEKLSVKELNPLGGIIENLRLSKDHSETEVIKKAVEVADNAFSHVLPYIKPGVSELDIAAEIEYFMKKQGAKGPSFETIVASGERSSMPHGVASGRKLKLGDAITLDYGALYNDYCSDMTRTVFLGNPCEELKKIYKIVLDAQISALNSTRSGMAAKDVDGVAREIINGSGYEKNFGHGLGHGVGLEIHEDPRLSPTGSSILQDGMVVTVEPGIYVEGLGGVRIEDIVVVNGDKPVVLTRSTKEMIII